MAALELTPFERGIEELTLKTPAPGKHCCRNALRCLKRAWDIKDIDPEMAVFRAITAEEESATAVFLSLKRRRYPGAKQLNPKNHVHKNALTPFIQLLRTSIAVLDNVLREPTLMIDEAQKRMRLRFTTDHPERGIVWVQSEQPLNGVLLLNGQPYDFLDDLRRFASERNVKQVIDHVRKRANQRNQLLYASAKGIPSCDVAQMDHMLGLRRANTFRNLGAFLLIDPYNTLQLFVQQALRAFLVMLNKVPPEIVFE